ATEQVTGRKSTISYWPSRSVATVRTSSMSAALAASTVTPGSTAPVPSLTTPAMPAVVADCAHTSPGTSRKPDNAKIRANRSALIGMPPQLARVALVTEVENVGENGH